MKTHLLPGPRKNDATPLPRHVQTVAFNQNCTRQLLSVMPNGPKQNMDILRKLDEKISIA
jgi:hypothetical protein